MSKLSRRRFLGHTTKAAATAGLVQALANVHAAGSDTIRVGLIGCGGRGTGAAAQAMKTGKDVRLVAMGDLFADKLARSRKILQAEGGANFAVGDDRCFVGFEAYRRVLDSGVDVVLLAEPPHFRPAHLEAAVAAGKHVFAEKPIAVDAQGVRRVDSACREAAKKRLSMVSGLMLHYEPGMQQTVEHIHKGAIGNIVSLQCNYNVGGLWVVRRQPEWTDMEWQLRNWYYFTWLSGDHIVEQHVHCLDLVSWVMNGQYPVRAVGMGGRQSRTGPEFGHIFDHHAVVYEYDNGVKCFSYTRQQDGTATDTSSWAYGTKGVANLLNRSISGETPWTYPGSNGRPRSRTFSGHQEEQDALFASIRAGMPINNGDYQCKSTLMAIMGRLATYTGQVITWDTAWNAKEDLTPPRYEFGPRATPPVAIPGVTRVS